MKVKLISKTENLLDVIYTGATTCYNAGSPIDKWNNVKKTSEDKKIKLIDACIKSGHTSVLEHTQFTFAIEGVSRALLAQLTRHRIGMSFSVQSQRYVSFENGFSYVDLPDTVENKIFQQKYKEIMEYLDEAYKDMINGGVKPENARSILPNACCTNIVVTCNLRSLIHLCHERLCTRAQKEIRLLVKEMVNQVLIDNEWLKPYLVPKCEMLGYCPEYNGCKKLPRLEELKN